MSISLSDTRSLEQDELDACQITGKSNSQEGFFIHGHLVTNKSVAELAQSLRATYQSLDTTPSSIDNQGDAQQTGYFSGCSASTTVVNGNQIITANIGNTSAFIALYDNKGSLIVVKELTNYEDSKNKIYTLHTN